VNRDHFHRKQFRSGVKTDGQSYETSSVSFTPLLPLWKGNSKRGDSRRMGIS
jgi:hypothetical protein